MSDQRVESAAKSPMELNLPRLEAGIDPSVNKAYFDYYGSLESQERMLADRVRIESYRKAVMDNRKDFEDRVVVDVGAGTGILSLFAAQVGAKVVYAVEASEMAKYARMLIAGNPNLGERIKVLHGKAEEVCLPENEEADVLISEPMGFLLLNERVLESYVIARERFLCPEGKMFPEKGIIYVAPFSNSELYEAIVDRAHFWMNENFYGINLSPLHDPALSYYFSEPILTNCQAHEILVPPCSHEIDFMSIKAEDLHEIKIPFKFTLSNTMKEEVHGLICWFDVHFPGSVFPSILTTKPSEQFTHWGQVICLLRTPIAARGGMEINGHLHKKVKEGDRSYTLRLSMQDDVGPESQATLDLNNTYDIRTFEDDVPDQADGPNQADGLHALL